MNSLYIICFIGVVIILNKFDRIESLEKTVSILKQALHTLDLKEEIVFQKSMDSLISATLTIPTLRAITNGKGVNFLMAEVSAYAEMIERISVGLETGFDMAPYSRIFTKRSERLQNFIDYKYMKGYRYTYQDSNVPVIKVESLLKDENFDKKDFDLLKTKSKLLKHWVSGNFLIDNKEIFIPPVFIKWISATNGLASGNTVKEAILHACYEIFERFAFIFFLKNPTYQAPTILNSSIKNKTIQEMIKFFENNGFDIEIKDLSFNCLFPVYAVMFFNNNVPTNCLMYNTIKAGASFNGETAIIRCFIERLQGTNIKDETCNSTLRNDNYPDKYLLLFFKGICHIDLNVYRSFQKISFRQHSESDLSTCLNKCIDITKKLKTDLVVVNHTHPVLKFPTVRVVMPGISDFIKWWDSNKVTVSLIGDYNEEEDKYQDKLFEIINSFWNKV